MSPEEVARQVFGQGGGMEGKLNVSRGEDKLIGKFKMSAGDVISIRYSLCSTWSISF